MFWAVGSLRVWLTGITECVQWSLSAKRSLLQTLDIFNLGIQILKISKFKKNQNSLLFWNKSHFLQLNTHYVHKHEPSQRSYHLEVIFLDCGCLYCHSLVSISVNQKCFNLVGITISKDSTSSSAGIVCLFSKNVYRIKTGCLLSNRHIKPVSDKQKLKILLSIV